MNLKPQDLEKEGYELLSSLHHDELIPFLKEAFQHKSDLIKRFNLWNVLLLVVLTGLFIFDYFTMAEFKWGTRFLYISLGVLLSFLLIPLHEFLHSLAYKYVGARQTSYDANWKKLYFMAMADQFVADYKEFKIVALTPLVAISFGLIFLAFLPIGLWRFSVISILITHSLFSSGDIAILNYFKKHRCKGLVTYDDKSERMSYFLIKSAKKNLEIDQL